MVSAKRRSGRVQLRWRSRVTARARFAWNRRNSDGCCGFSLAEAKNTAVDVLRPVVIYDDPEMAEDVRKYLATQILGDQCIVSYRSLSRAFKVHVNAAKCMLDEFYKHENCKREGSVHATYLLAGVKKQELQKSATNGHTNGAHQGAGIPPSSPPPFTSSMVEPSQQDSESGNEERTTVPTKTIVLVREEALNAVKEQYETITSLHIYSLSPHPVQDLASLTDVGRALFAEVFVAEDPLAYNNVYGVIKNSRARRRKDKRPVVAPTSKSTFQPVEEENKTTTSKLAPVPIKKEEWSRPGSSGCTAPMASTTKQVPLKRDASDLFKSFAKAKTKPSLSRQDTEQSTNTSVSGADEDAKMTDAADDEDGESEDESLFLDTGTRKPASSATAKKRASDAKKEREDKAAKLRKMMDSDDEDGPADNNNRRPADGTQESELDKAAARRYQKGDQEEEDVAWSDSDTEGQRGRAPSTATRTAVASREPNAGAGAGGGRKRGRRKVIKKRTMKDEEGYLVTKEEAVWESFSESEPEKSSSSHRQPELAQQQRQKQTGPATKQGSSTKTCGSAKPNWSSSAASSGGGAGGGPQQSKGGKAGAGKANIMSFFGKK